MSDKPTNKVILKLPFRRGGFFSITIKRKIGFVFDNYVSHMVFIASGAKDVDEFKEWCNLENGALRNFEYLYCAAVRYCELIRKSDNFTRVSLKRALTEAEGSQVKLLTDCIHRSEMYGATFKKKQKTTGKSGHRKKSMSSVLKLD